MEKNCTGIYKHYKGGNYEVLMLGRQEGSLERVVVYRSLQDSGDFPAGTIWIRPEKEFLEEVEHDGNIVPRFQKGERVPSAAQ